MASVFLYQSKILKYIAIAMFLVLIGINCQNTLESEVDDGHLLIKNFRLMPIKNLKASMAIEPLQQFGSKNQSLDHNQRLSRDSRNLRILQTCPSSYSDATVTGTTSGAVWGSSPYTDDSSLGAIAVHAGLLQVGQTGIIRRYTYGYYTTYTASTRNGVTTMAYGGFCGVTVGLVSLVLVSNCSSYSGSTCVSCNYGYSLTSSAGTQVCVRNQFYDPNCYSYSLIANNDYLCSSCSSGTLSNFYTNTVGQVNKCLSSSQQIRDCSVYETYNSLYQCYTCASITNIALYSITYNGQTLNRCINSAIEYVPSCTAYDYISSLYRCNSCSNGYQLITVTVNSSPQPRCLDTTTQVVPNCTVYSMISNTIACTACNTDSTLKTVSGVSKCLLNIVIDPQCTNYIFNGISYECSVCASSYTLSDVLVSSAIYKYCILTTSLIRSCSKYEIVSGNYQCYECLGTNIARYTFILNTIQLYRCLNTLTEYVNYCSTYQYASSVYTCTNCSSGYQVQQIPINSISEPRCLSTTTQTVSNCAAYVTDTTYGYVCNQCATGFTLKTVSGVPKCLPNIVIDSQCTTYVLNGSNYECSQCGTGFTLKTILGIPKCLPNIVIDQYCMTYILNGSNYECSQCSSSSYTLTSLYTDQGTFRYCFQTSTQFVRDCLVHQSITGGYECKQCSSSQNITRKSFSYNGLQGYRCINAYSQHIDRCTTYQMENDVYACSVCENGYTTASATNNSLTRNFCISTQSQVIPYCSNFTIDSTGVFICNACSSTYTLQAVLQVNKCLPDNIIDAQCAKYLYNYQINKYSCTRCSISYTLSDALVNGQILKRCLSNTSQVITNCSKYTLLANGTYECSECVDGYSKGTVQQDSSTVVKCLQNKAQNVEDCELYLVNSTGAYVCTQCKNGLTLKNGLNKKVCVSTDDIQDNCTEYKDKGTLQECIQCESSFTLSVYNSNGNLFSKCLPTQTHLLTGCSVYETSANGDLQCNQCDQLHSLQLVDVSQTKSMKKCINAEDVVSQCLSYVSVGLSCAHDCNSCSLGFRHTNVKVGHRITKGCLSQAIEYLPFCKMHIKENGVYNCRHGICDTGSFSIKIGPSPNELACTTDDLIRLINDEQCQYFKRPHLTDTIIYCQKCKTGFLQPYCS